MLGCNVTMTSNESDSITEIEYNISSRNFWDYCPVEILFIIFGKLDATSLRCCSRVNRKWNEIALKSCETRCLWRELAEGGVVNHGAHLRHKSALTWKDIYYNSLLWDNVQHASITKTHETANNIKNMHVYKDNIIVVNNTRVIYYNIETFDCVKVIPLLCEDFQETNDTVLVATIFDGIHYNLTLFRKMHGKKEFKHIENHFSNFSVFNNSCEFMKCSRWLIHNNTCYVIDSKHVLWEAKGTNKKWIVKSLARYYGGHSISRTIESTLHNIHVIDKDVYVSLNWGDLIELNKKRFAFQKVRASSIPTFYSTGQNIFKTPPPPSGCPDKFSALINVPIASGFLEEFRDQTKLHFHYDDPEMTCAMQHGAIVFLGFEDGRVEIHSLKKKKCQNQFPAAAVKLDVKEFDDGVVEDPAIRGLEVCELKNMHKLFIRTSQKLYHLLFKYPDSLLDYYLLE